LTVFVNDLFLALGLVAMVDCARSCYTQFKQATGWERVTYGSHAAVVAFGLGGVIAYWISLQVFLFRKLPPELASVSVLSTVSSPYDIVAVLHHALSSAIWLY
jgi:hypothetical protein